MVKASGTTQSVVKKRREKIEIGWREWVHLPELGGACVKAKVDTGARTSAIHAWNIRAVERNGQPFALFDLHPLQNDNECILQCEAPIIDRREIRNSGGQAQERYIIRTTVNLGSYSWPIELSLTRRDEMGFRMLLGRAGVRRRFLVDPGRSFLMGDPR